MRNTAILKTKTGEYELPIFLPVYQPYSNLVPVDAFITDYGFRGLIMNSFFLYKNKETKNLLLDGMTVKEYIGFNGLVMTDSGAFQGLKRPLYLSNKKIVSFQDQIGADIISPLDLITPPGDNYTTALQKVIVTNERILEAKQLTKRSVLAGVQQGGKFLDLRKKSLEGLLEIGIEYLAIGSLVPFFNKRHDLSFVIKVMKDVMAAFGDSNIPIHIYGAGDPVELPFLFYLGARIFDSSSYGHYANQGWYMTRYGAILQHEADKLEEYDCKCPVCAQPAGRMAVFNDAPELARHNLYVIKETMDLIKEEHDKGKLEDYLQKVLTVHERWFESSLLVPTWEVN
ncbi:MAG TPA: tRNA-guanine transglycosylase [Chitinophagaceae bacterium]|nr:tRNA-guanine transglycosylase [Chitinophagaceae bacterium]